MLKKIIYIILIVFCFCMIYETSVYAVDTNFCCMDGSDMHRCGKEYNYYKVPKSERTEDTPCYYREAGPSMIGIWHALQKSLSRGSARTWLASTPVTGRVGSEHSPIYDSSGGDGITHNKKGAICFGHTHTTDDPYSINKIIREVYDTFDENTERINGNARVQELGYVAYKSTAGGQDPSNAWVGYWLKTYSGLPTQHIDGYTLGDYPTAAATQYATRAANETFDTRSTSNSTRQDISYRTYGGRTYTFIGPYYLDTSFGRLDSARITGSSNVTTTLCSTDGKTVQSLSSIGYIYNSDYEYVDQSYNGSEFYIVVDGTNITSVSNIALTKNVEVISARVVPAQSLGGDNQYIAIYWGEKMSFTKTLNLPGVILGNLTIVKEDSDNSRVKLAGVKFSIKGPYKKDEYPGYNIADVLKVDAEYTTDSRGEIYLPNIIRGVYKITETKIDIYGYELDSTEQTVYVSPGTYTTKTIKNIKQTGNYGIRKRDTDSKNPLVGVSFKLRASNGRYIRLKTEEGRYIYRVTGTIMVEDLDYTSESSGTTFTSDSGGNINIYNLIRGTYTLKEISVGNNEYHEVDPDYITWSSSSGSSGSGNDAKVYVKRQSSLQTDNTNSTIATSTLVNNRRKYVDIEGFVWEDRLIGKATTRDNKYIENASKKKENGDMLLANVKVSLVEGVNETPSMLKAGVASPYITQSDGRYTFEKVVIDKLKDTYVIFEYNGMNYQVVPLMDNNPRTQTNKAADWYGQKGSKVLGPQSRQIYNDRFSIITKGNSQNESKAYANTSQQIGLTVKYDKLTNSSNVKLQDNVSGYKYGYTGQNYPINGIDSQYLIQSATNKLDQIRNPMDIRVNEETMISNINLGVYERERPDTFLTKDIKNTNVTIRGYEHVYEYGQRLATRGTRQKTSNAVDGRSDFYKNPGTKFTDKYIKEYTQPIYRADYSYDNKESDSRDEELCLYLTYQIGLANQAIETCQNAESKGVITVVNKVVDYFDENYEVVAAGTQVDDRGNITKGKELKWTADGKSNGYKKIIIDANVELNTQEEKMIYVQFKVSRENIATLMIDQSTKKEINVGAKTNKNLENVAEVLSYSVKKDGKAYAAIDVHSNPGNATPGKPETYENDTDRAPNIKLKVAESRDMNGVVFLEDTGGDISEIHVGQERKGNGKLDDKDLFVKAVDVDIWDMERNKITRYFDESQKKWVDAKFSTTQKGEYHFEGLLPGEYQVRYTWGGEDAYGNSITKISYLLVEDYKGTLYDETRYNKNTNEKDHYYWYKDESETPRLQDATDDWAKRQAIDEKIKLIKHNTSETIDEEFNDPSKKANHKITSSTPQMRLKIEYQDRDDDVNAKDITTKCDSKYDATLRKYLINNIDYGIVERPRQNIELINEIKNVIVRAANGQKLIETVKGPNPGELVGSSLIHRPSTNSKDYGIMNITMDIELMQGAVLEIIYEIKVNNLSELDYNNERYYKYGTNKTESTLVKLTPSKIVNYITDELLYYGEDSSEIWTQSTKDSFKVAKSVDKFGKESELVSKPTINAAVKDNIKILTTNKYNAKLAPKASQVVEDTLRVIAALESISGDFVAESEAEIIEVTKNGGRSTLGRYPKDKNAGTVRRNLTIPGNYIPGQSVADEEYDDDAAEILTITPPHGANRSRILITVASFALIEIAVGAYIIKKKVLGK